MSTSDFIPASDADALTWMQTFAAGISASVATYDLVAADATAIDTAVDAFAAAFAVSSNPATRTPVTINLKEVARDTAEAVCRQYAAQIKVNAGVSDANKIAIGVRPVNTGRTPVPVPSTSPLLNIVMATPGVLVARYADSATPDSGAKPAGATNLQLFVATGTAAAVDPAAADFVGAFTRNPIELPFAAADDGKVATLFGRWATRTGEVGPWSLPVSMRIAA
jgi:hypothetical protein